VTVNDNNNVDRLRHIIYVNSGTQNALSLPALGLSGTILGVTPSSSSSVISVGSTTVNNTTAWVINVSENATIGDTLDVYIDYIDTDGCYKYTKYTIIVS